MTKEDMTKKYMEFQVLSQQINKFQQQINLITQQVGELNSLSNNVSEISKINQDSEMYTNLGVGVHIKSSIKNVKNLLVNVGAGIFVKKTPEETTKIVDRQVVELEKVITNMETQLQNSVKKAESIKQELSKEKK